MGDQPSTNANSKQNQEHLAQTPAETDFDDSNPESTDVELNLDLHDSSGSSMKESDPEVASVKSIRVATPKKTPDKGDDSLGEQNNSKQNQDASSKNDDKLSKERSNSARDNKERKSSGRPNPDNQRQQSGRPSSQHKGSSSEPTKQTSSKDSNKQQGDNKAKLEDDEDDDYIKEDTNEDAPDLTDDDVAKDHDTEKVNTPQLRKKSSSRRKSASFKQREKEKEREKTPRDEQKQTSAKLDGRSKTPSQKGRDSKTGNKTPRQDKDRDSKTNTPRSKTPRQPSAKEKHLKPESQRTKYTGMYARKIQAPKHYSRNSSQRSSVGPSRATNKSQMTTSRSTDSQKKSKEAQYKSKLVRPKQAPKPQSSLMAFNSPVERVDVEIFKAKEPLYYHAFVWNDTVFREMVHSGIFSQDELYALKVSSAMCLELCKSFLKSCVL